MTRRTILALSTVLLGITASLVDQAAAHAGFCYMCGSNSATLGDDLRVDVAFDELNLKNAVRTDGPRIKILASRLRAPTSTTPVAVKLGVTNDVLSAFAGPSTFTGAELVQGELTIDLKYGGNTYQIRAFQFEPCEGAACHPLTFWVAPQTKVPHWVFRVRMLTPPGASGGGTGSPAGTGGAPGISGAGGRGPTGNPGGPGGIVPPPLRIVTADSPWTGQEAFLCRAGYTGDSTVPASSAWELVKHSAIIYQGDQYDRKRKVVQKSEPGWFNIACAGTVIYKMHLLRHTGAGRTLGKSTSLPQRTAMLKAIMADYCGDGKVWTGDGTPLHWTDSRGFFPDPALDVTALDQANMIEAIWGPDGAVCLNTPRRLPKVPNPVWNDGSKCTDPAVRRAEVVANCSWMNKVYKALPPPTPEEKKEAKKGKILAPAPTPHLPKCTEAWVNWWNKRNRNGIDPYVLTANVSGKNANYCDRDDVTAPTSP